MNIDYMRLIFYGFLSLSVYNLSTPVLSIDRIIGYDTRLTKREDIRHIFIAQATNDNLIYTGFEFTTSAQPDTSIPSFMASLGSGYRYSITPAQHTGAYVFLDYGIDKHHTLHTALTSWLQPIKQSSLAAAYLLRNIPLPSTDAAYQEKQFMNLNIGFEYWVSDLKSYLNFYFPLYSNVHALSQCPFYIEDDYYGADIQWLYQLNSTMIPFMGFYGSCQSNRPSMIGWACGLTAYLHSQCTIDLKYTIDSLRGQSWSIITQTQLNKWLKFYCKYTYDMEQGHTTSLSSLRGLFIGLQWNFDETPRQNSAIFPRHRHLSPIMLRVAANVTE